MRFTFTSGLVILALAGLATPALAADDATMAFPPACRAQAPQPAADAHAGHGAAMQDHQMAAMPGMATMNRDMAAGMAQRDADVAFVCGMIAHHQGAIAMAEVELRYGKDAFARQMAEKVIAAQRQEIAEMQAWVAKTVKK